MAQQALFNSPPTIGMSSCKFSPPNGNKDVLKLEGKLKNQANSKRIRMAEYFGDFDPLRSGFITRDQFRRSMDHHLGMSLSDRESELLTSKYASGGNRVNYRQFVNGMEKEFDPNNFSKSQLSKEEWPQIKLTQFDEKTEQLMQMCARYYKNRGIRVKTCYQDFDRHNMGYVTLSQFHRSFPGPPEIKESEISQIAQHYLESSVGLYNYLRFSSDIEVFWEREQQKCNSRAPNMILPQGEKKRSLEEILQCIRDTVYKNGIRTNEFFCDHDKLRTGFITENQFICGLLLCLGKYTQLSREDVQKVVKHYQLPDGRIHYKDFCHLLENTYTAPYLEQNPRQVIERPLCGELHKQLNVLSTEEEKQLEVLLQRLQEEVKRRRILLHPHFKDFDRSKAYTRGVTAAQFKRVLDFVGLFITPEEFKLILKKYADPVGGDIVYPAFIQAVDEDFVGHIVKEISTDIAESSKDEKPCNEEIVDIDNVLAFMRSYVVANRIRTCEHFQDFDCLRSGSISFSRFRQGLSSLGFANLSVPQFKALCMRYKHPKSPASIRWRLFVEDIDKAFREWPETSSSAHHVDVAQSEESAVGQDQLLAEVMKRLKERICQRRILVKPSFQDFDRHNMGYTTKSQFRQCLRHLELPVSEEEMVLMETKFSNHKGFKYLEFLRELQPPPFLENKYEQRLETLVDTKLKLSQASAASETTDLIELANVVMDKIRTKVSKERIRVIEFMIDYDKLRFGRILVQSFIRALDLCGFKLSMIEIKALVERYRSSKDPNYVDYNQFSDDIESIFTTKELEKMPVAQVEQFIPPEEVDLNQLSLEQEQMLMKCVHRLAERVRVRRIQLFPLFEDYDRVHIGSVTTSQFRRVLNELELGGLLSDLEYDIIYNKFGVQVGGRKDVYYIAFCAMVEEFSLSRWNDPELK